MPSRAVIVAITLLLSAALSVDADDAPEPEPLPEQRILFFSDQPCRLSDCYSEKLGIDHDQVVIAAASGIATVTLDGSGSYDPDGFIEGYIWGPEDSSFVTFGVNPTVELGIGVHVITLIVTDDIGAIDSDDVTITVAADAPQPVVLCDTEFDPYEIRLPDPFPGVYYYYDDEALQAEVGFPLKRIDQHGTTALDGPQIPNLTQWHLPFHVSPDGRFMVFEPRYYGPDRVTPDLFVWRIGTEETASILLNDEEYRSLVDDHLPYYRRRARLTWQGSDRLVLRFFRESGFPDILHLVAETEFVLTEDPLTLTRGAHTTITYPEYPPPPDYTRRGYARSPQENFTLFVSRRHHIPELGSGGASYQVYDTHTNELLFEHIPSQEIGLPVGGLLWTEDEQTFYYQRRLPVGASPYFGAHTELFEVDVSAGFIESDHIHRAVEEVLETSTLLGFNPVLSDDDDLLAFNVVSSIDGEHWIVIYRRSTEELTLICNPFRFLNYNMIYPFWPPGGDHFAYWNAGNIAVFDINTGELYRLPGILAFIDWVEAISVLTADAGPDQTVTADDD